MGLIHSICKRTECANYRASGARMLNARGSRRDSGRGARTSHPTTSCTTKTVPRRGRLVSNPTSTVLRFSFAVVALQHGPFSTPNHIRPVNRHHLAPWRHSLEAGVAGLGLPDEGEPRKAAPATVQPRSRSAAA